MKLPLLAMRVKGSPIVVMMMFEKVATPPDAAMVVVPDRSPLAGAPFRSSATETFPLYPVARFPYWSSTSTMPPKAKFSVTRAGGSVTQTSCAGAAGVILMEVEMASRQSAARCLELVGPDGVDGQVREGRDAVDRIDCQGAGGVERAGGIVRQLDRHRAIEREIDAAGLVFGVDDHVRAGCEILARDRRRNWLARGREHQLRGRGRPSH